MTNPQNTKNIASSSADGLPHPQRLRAIFTILCGIAMAVLNGVITNVALPTISQDLSATPAETIWIVNSYQIAIIVALLPCSYIGEMIGYRRVYQVGLVVFSITSLLCAFSSTLDLLTYARVLQGLGAAALMSVNTALLRLIYPQRMLGRGLGINSLIVACAAASGPTIGAAILSISSWHWLFLINVPFGLVALFLSWKFLPDNPSKNSKQKFDIPSGIMNALTFGLILIAITGFSQNHSLTFIAITFVIGLLIGVVFVRRQLTLEVPLLPVDLLRIPIFALSIGTSVCSFAAQMLAFVALPFFLQDVLGKTTVETGLLLTPWPIAIMIASPLAGRLVERFHAGLLGGIGLALMSFGLFSLVYLPDDPSNFSIVWRMLACGAGFGLFQSPNNHTIITSAPKQRSGGASGMLGTARLLGQSTGTALVALMFNAFTDQGTQASLMLAGGFALVAAIVSCLRLTQPRSAN